jgi:hypothetical protein
MTMFDGVVKKIIYIGVITKLISNTMLPEAFLSNTSFSKFFLRLEWRSAIGGFLIKSFLLK